MISLMGNRNREPRTAGCGLVTWTHQECQVDMDTLSCSDVSQNLQQHINMTSRAICSVTFYHLATRHQQSCQFFVIKQTLRLFILKECQKSTNRVRLGQSRDHSDLSIMKCKHCVCRSEFCCEFFAGFTKLASLA